MQLTNDRRPDLRPRRSRRRRPRSPARPTWRSGPTRTTSRSWPTTASSRASDTTTAGSSAVTVTDGAGSPRSAHYADYTDDADAASFASSRRRRPRRRRVRRRGTPRLSEFSGQGRRQRTAIVDELAALDHGRRPRRRLHPQPRRQTRHPRGRGAAHHRRLRRLPVRTRGPAAVYGCEVWRDLDWMCDARQGRLRRHRIARTWPPRSWGSTTPRSPAANATTWQPPDDASPTPPSRRATPSTPPKPSSTPWT